MPQKDLYAFFKKTPTKKSDKKTPIKKHVKLVSPVTKKRKRETDAESSKPQKRAKGSTLTPDQKKLIEEKKRAAQLKRKKRANEKLKGLQGATYTDLEDTLHSSWKSKLEGEFKKPYFKKLKENLKKEEQSGATIFPPAPEVYAAFSLCPWNKLKLVILGQDPYHNVGQAEGLCFSVKKTLKKLPPSLKNMYKEAESDLDDFKHPGHGSLKEWANQGILLLNTGLTVRAHQANSHKKYGWLKFTDSVINLINKDHEGVVFLLWGGQAKKKVKMINKDKHKIVESAHPSPLSAYRGFFGSKPYTKVNKCLEELGKEPIDWNITP